MHPSTPVTGRRSLAALIALAAALMAAFVVAPPVLAATGSAGDLADRRRFTDSVDAAFVEYWRAGVREYPPHLRTVVEYWARFHVIKAVIAGLLVVVSVALAVRLWKAFVRTDRRRAALATGGVGATVVGLFSLVVVMANLQGAVAPFASLLPTVVGDPDGEQARRALADGSGYPPPLDVMIDQFAYYHAVMAVIATIVAIAFVATGVLLWRRSRATGDRTARRVLRSFVAVAAVVVLAAVVLAVVNTTTAADPEPALLALFGGSW